MTTRTLTKTVTFSRPFYIGGFDEVLPAGEYCVETDEELLAGLSFSAYRGMRTVIHLRAKSGNPNLTRALTVDPSELDAALMRDQEPADMCAATDIDEVMADPIAHLVMRSDGLSVAAVWKVIKTVRAHLAARSDQKVPEGKMASGRERIDSQAIERGEDEGMMVHPI